MSSHHEDRHRREDNRNEAVLRVRALAHQEQHARDTMLERLVGALVQRPEPHVFHECPVLPWAPWNERHDAPGTMDSTGFSDGIV